MDENQKQSLTRIYNIYQKIDWAIAIAVTLGLIFGVPALPIALVAAIFVAGFIYTSWTVWLYVKVWPIKEIRNTGVYVFDWFLTIALTVFEIYILYIVLTGSEPFWINMLDTMLQ